MRAVPMRIDGSWFHCVSQKSSPISTILQTFRTNVWFPRKTELSSTKGDASVPTTHPHRSGPYAPEILDPIVGRICLLVNTIARVKRGNKVSTIQVIVRLA